MLLVLGMLCLRALIPAGFMLAPVDGRLAFVLCEAEGPAAGHHHSGHDHAMHHHGAADPTCPYAQSAGPAPLPTLPVLAGAAFLDVLISPTDYSQTLLRFGPTRQPSSRGPPRLA